MKIYDKAQWHIDAGEKNEKVIKKFNEVLTFLNDKNLLSKDGFEIFEFGVDSSISLTERMVNEKGAYFLDLCYDKVIGLDVEDIVFSLEKLYEEIE